MLKIFQLVIGLSLIFFIIPQTPTENIVLRKIVETGLFTNYNKAKDFLTQLTWGLIISFLILLILLNMKIF